MHKLTLLAILPLVGLTLPSSAAASSSTIKFEGLLYEETCQVTPSDTTIIMPNVSATLLQKAGDTADGTKFTITLSGDKCVDKKALAFFQTNYVSSDFRLVNSAYYGATNVELELYDEANNPIKIGEPSQLDSPAVWQPIESNKATLTYGVRYYATGPVTSGSVWSIVYYYIAYQ